MEIIIEDLSKIYENGHRALSNVNITISNGMFGLLGPNGAGKSTLMRIIVTLMKPTTGRVLVNGKDLQENRTDIRKMLGYLPQDFRFFPKLKTYEFLEYTARLHGIKEAKKRSVAVDKMLDEVGLFEARDRMANKLSGGMKRRLGIAQALIGNPGIIVVDEPTTGLDPEERIRFRNLLSAISSRDIVIILSTHIVGDISSTCRNMALLNQGELAFLGTPPELIDKTKGHVWRMMVPLEELEVISDKFPVISTIPTTNGWEVEFVATESAIKNAISVEPNLEHAYVHFMENILNQRIEEK